MEICPCCKRKMVAPRATMDKRIVQDIAKAQAAIAHCENALVNPWFANAKVAIQDEVVRLNRALTDHRLLWTLYRRADKKPPYYTLAD